MDLIKSLARLTSWVLDISHQWLYMAKCKLGLVNLDSVHLVSLHSHALVSQLYEPCLHLLLLIIGDFFSVAYLQTSLLCLIIIIPQGPHQPVIASVRDEFNV